MEFRKTALKRSLFLFFLVFGFVQLSLAQQVNVYLMRHAEKAADDPRDPSLNEKGDIRAKQLVSFFENQSFDRFFSTPYKRTKGTVAYLAEKNGKEITEYAPTMHNELVKQVKALDGETVFIVGHSNTIPDLLNKFTNSDEYKMIDHERYGDIWLVTIDGDKVKVYPFYLK